MTPPLALDLCCGLGGWARGLIDAGWCVVGVDLNAAFAADYPGEFIASDVRTFRWDAARGHVGLVVASPPCQEFSYRAMPWSRARNLPPPDKSIWEACVRIAKELGAPLILENVKGAQKYMGKAAWHFGSYYLWGDVPALWPIPNHRCGARIPGQDWSRYHKTGEVSPQWNIQGVKQPGLKGRKWFSEGMAKLPSGSSRRKLASAMIAMIPYPLALHVGQVFHPGEAA